MARSTAPQPMIVDEDWRGALTHSEVVPEMPKRRLSLSDLPWDTVGIIFDFTSKLDYNKFRLNRTFTRLINKRRKGLTFRDKAILPETFG